jgi:glycine cleavage system H protein
MAHPNDRSYSKDHLWVFVDGDTATLGITDYAQDQLGDVVFVDLPGEGDEAAAGDAFGEVESVKSVSELISPVTGEIVEVNDSLSDASETINADPHGAGWMIKVRMSDDSEVDDLMTAEQYDEFVSQS